MLTARTERFGGKTSVLTTTVLIVATLYFAREVFIPFALALLLSFLLGPFVTRLQVWGLKRIPAVLTVLVLGFALFGFVAAELTLQLMDLSGDLPNYQQNLKVKLQKLKVPKGGRVERVVKMFGELEKDLPGPTVDADRANLSIKTAAEVPAAPDSAKPIPVEVRTAPVSSVEVARGLASSLVNPLATAGVVAVFVIFMLIQREDLRNRFLRLVGAEQLNVTTHALDDAANRVSRYLVMQLIVNACYGIPIGIGLFLIGVPNPILWGLLATFLRFIPYAGPVIAAILPIGLALAVDPGWSKALMSGTLFIVLELITNNVLEPWLYGSSVGVSAVGLLVATVFWTWLWGPIGLLLSTPLTVCLAVIGKYVPHLEFLNVLLGDTPVLAPAESFYQRMLAMDQAEATELAEKFLENHPLEELYDTVIIPALSLAEQDRHRGALTEERQRFLTKSTREIIEDLIERDEAADPLPDSTPSDHFAVLCIPAKDEADELAALMLSHVLSRHELRAQVVRAKLTGDDWLPEVSRNQPQVVCVSSIPPYGLIATRHLCRRLQQKFPDLRLVVGLWNIDAEAKNLQKRLATITSENVVTSLKQAVQQLLPLANPVITDPMEPAPIAEHEQDRLAELKRITEHDADSAAICTAATRELSKVFNLPISLMSYIDKDKQIWKSQLGPAESLAAGPDSPRDTSICGHVVAANQLIVVKDLKKDRRFANNPMLRERGFRFYAGVPLRTKRGLPIGAMCIIDTKPGNLTERDKALLSMMADKVMTEIEGLAKDP